MQNNAILYARSSAGQSQTVAQQVAELRDIAASFGWTVVAELFDHGDLDAKRRPGFETLGKRIGRGDVGMVVLPSLLHVGGSIEDVVTFIADLHAAGVCLYLVEEEIDTRTPAGAAWMAAMMTLDNHRKSIRMERARVGRERAMAAGVKFGRPPISDMKIRAVRLALEAGCGIRPTARQCGVSPAKVSSIQREMAGRDGAVETVAA
jgi:DNA invertase Pin-like site-specific DNA recombinase